MLKLQKNRQLYAYLIQIPIDYWSLFNKLETQQPKTTFYAMKIRYTKNELKNFILKSGQALKESEQLQLKGKKRIQRRLKEINELTADLTYLISQGR